MLLSGACEAGHVRLGVFLVEFGEAGAEGVQRGEMGFVLGFLGGGAFFEVIKPNG